MIDQVLRAGSSVEIARHQYIETWRLGLKGT